MPEMQVSAHASTLILNQITSGSDFGLTWITIQVSGSFGSVMLTWFQPWCLCMYVYVHTRIYMYALYVCVCLCVCVCVCVYVLCVHAWTAYQCLLIAGRGMINLFS